MKRLFLFFLMCLPMMVAAQEQNDSIQVVDLNRTFSFGGKAIMCLRSANADKRSLQPLEWTLKNDHIGDNNIVVLDVKNAKTETEAMQIAVENFGSRSGAEMVRVLRTGSDSAEDLANALRNASGALKRTDEASRTSKDAFDDLKATVQGIVSSLGNVDESIKNIVDNIRIELAKIDLEKLKKGFEDFKE